MKKIVYFRENLSQCLIYISLISVFAFLFLVLDPSPDLFAKSGHNQDSVSKGKHGQGGKSGGANTHGSKGKGKSHDTSSASTETRVESSNGAESSSSSSHSSSSNRGGKGKSGGGRNSTAGGDIQSDSSSHGSGSKGGKGGKGGKGSSGHDADDVSISTDDDDSDRPAWAGKDGNHDLKPGGGNSGHDTKKGGDYGDMFVLDRYDDGTLKYYDEEENLCDTGDGCYPAAVLLLDDGTFDLFVLTEDAEAPNNVIEIELGRLNVSRAPDKVLNHSLEEALSKLDGLKITAENLSTKTDLSGRVLLPGSATAIDSPLENLALYKAILEAYVDASTDINLTYEGYSITLEAEVVPQVLASTLAAATDKTNVVEIDEVVYLSKFLDVEEKLNALVEDYDNWYTKEDVYDVTISVLDLSSDPPQWKTNTNLLNEVPFTATADFTVIDQDFNGIDYFTMAVDDSLQVLEFIHDSILQ